MASFDRGAVELALVGRRYGEVERECVACIEDRGEAGKHECAGEGECWCEGCLVLLCQSLYEQGRSSEALRMLLSFYAAPCQMPYSVLSVLVSLVAGEGGELEDARLALDMGLQYLSYRRLSLPRDSYMALLKHLMLRVILPRPSMHPRVSSLLLPAEHCPPLLAQDIASLRASMASVLQPRAKRSPPPPPDASDSHASSSSSPEDGSDALLPPPSSPDYHLMRFYTRLLGLGFGSLMAALVLYRLRKRVLRPLWNVVKLAFTQQYGARRI